MGVWINGSWEWELGWGMFVDLINQIGSYVPIDGKPDHWIWVKEKSGTLI